MFFLLPDLHQQRKAKWNKTRCIIALQQRDLEIICTDSFLLTNCAKRGREKVRDSQIYGVPFASCCCFSLCKEGAKAAKEKRIKQGKERNAKMTFCPEILANPGGASLSFGVAVVSSLGLEEQASV